MTHNQQHVIIHRIRSFIATWPLSVASGTGALGAIIGAWVF